MASSGSTDYTRTRDQIITRAMRLCNAIALGEPPSNEEMQAGSVALNDMVKHWSARGIRLWKAQECVLFLTAGTERYTLGPTGSRASLVTNAVVTQLNGAEALGQTVITVDSTTGIENGDVIGVVQDDDTIHWTTVNGAPTSTDITLTAATTVAAADNNLVYSYSALIPRPLRITDARRRDETATQDTPFSRMLSHDDYFRLPNKTNQGKPVQGYYDPQLTNGVLYLWQAPDTVNDTIRFTAHLPIEDFDATANTPDFPQEWFRALAFNLAVDLAPELGGIVRPDVTAIAMQSLEEMLQADQEPGSIRFEPDLSEY